ncbi:BglG family transcription antiterminator [Caproiciproducens sp. R1]|uniref:BglG family transcription antiterminator n=1 Tax=Caproiciproducens sp. R1 TaxID=3435000 RepID=UPI0040341EB0
MKINTDALLSILKQHTGWVESKYLADTFRVTSRTIRNYVNRLNAESQRPLIESSYHGYRFISEAENRNSAVPEKSENRTNYVVRRLIGATEPVNVYDLADELFISDSTLESDIKRARNSIKYFGLQIIRTRDTIMISGEEVNKRKLINHLIAVENPENFMAFAHSNILSGDYQSTRLGNKISEVFRQHNLYINDYGLNNIILHIIVTVDRIKKGQNVSEKVALAKVQETKDYFVAVEIKKLMEDIYHIPISDAELYYLTLIISSNSNTLDYSFVTRDNITEYIHEKYIRITRDVIRRLEETYYLEPFDDDFLLKVTIHIHNLFQRATNGIFVRNPLTEKMKAAYPLIYDMAVFVANELRDQEALYLNEDEIAFLAFHIGSYLENNKMIRNKVTCIFVYAKYYNMHQAALDQIKEAFRDDITLIKVASVTDMETLKVSADLIITSVNGDFQTDGKIVRINPFLTRQDIEHIRTEIEKIKTEKRNRLTSSNIKRFLGRRLFKKEFYAKDEFEMIDLLTTECHELGLCDSSFRDEVTERESLSSTSFANMVAVPHSLKQNALHSFLSVVINEKPMQWGNYSVNIIVLIGINKEDRPAFRELFDDLINILSEPIHVSELVRCTDYDDFVKALTNMMTE